MDSTLDHTNYWQVASDTRREKVRECWRLRPTANLISFGLSLLYRLVISYFVFPATLIFGVFFLESVSEGLVQTLNALFTVTSTASPVDSADARWLLRLWHTVALVFFAMSWIFPWKSPAQREASSIMDRWHFEHGDKMLPPSESE
jgi:hypothetical protein